MRLRSNGINRTRTARHTLRLALSLALSGSLWTNIHAESPALIGAAQQPATAATSSELLPYPFPQAAASVQSAAKRQTVDPAAASRQLVKLVGLQTRAQTKLASTSVSSVPRLPALTSSIIAAQTQQPSSNGVVMASATEENSANQKTTEQTAVGIPPKLPAIPVLPSLRTNASKPATLSTDKPKAALTESLLDIEIPIDLAITGPALPTSAVSKPNTTVDSSKPSECTKGNCPSESTSKLAGVVQTCEPPQLIGSETIQSPKSSPNSSVNNSTVAKQPQLVRATKALSLKGEVGQTQAVSGPVSLNLNDSSTAPQNHPGTTERGAVLHLSSGSDYAEIKSATHSTISKLPMQVRIEGEPAPVVSSTGSRSGSLLQSAPMMPLKQPIGQVLAPQATPAVSPDGQATSQPKNQTNSPLSVGLQESTTLSTEYSIAELSVEHPSICQLLKTSERSISVIGMRPGTTRIALISYDAQGERAVDVREVAVGESSPTEVNLPELVKEVSRTVKQMFPKSDVRIVAYQDYVLVQGYTNYESDAKKILALVRKTSLFPVVDQLTTSGN